MDNATAQALNQLNSDFYQRTEASFSATRQAPWHGWERIRTWLEGSATALAAASASADPRTQVVDAKCDLRVLDLACGNLRFERYLATSFPHLHAWAVDNCDGLAHPHNLPANVTYQHLDIIQTLLAGRRLSHALDAPPCDVCVCFGFMHHVALPEHRLRVLEALVDQTRPGGSVIVSFWQFARDPRILAKAQPLAAPGDYLLGWQREQDVHRYCHSFSDDEILGLLASLPQRASLADRFQADGKHDNLNCYIRLQIS